MIARTCVALPLSLLTFQDAEAQTNAAAAPPESNRWVDPGWDMGLVCFDDVEHLAVLSPFLTVIDQPAETFGSLGAQLLFERITGKAGLRSRRIVLQTDLIVRESCCVNSGVPQR
jgi:hypothetical protein